ncbi:MAG: PqqD family protein [Desulfobacteraceae bacterium]|nr:MAG: PqqD family protein [Desulfobacteraceae bacterium]
MEKKAYRKNSRIIYREEGEGAFLFNPVDGNLKYLNRSAKEIFNLLDPVRESRHIVASFCGEHPEIGEDRIRKDVDLLLNQLAENRFIECIDIDSTQSDA